MKSLPSQKRTGFTLIELLVVIAIIAVLAAAGFTAGLSAIQKAKRTSALNVATAIEQAINNFYSEYGYLPDPGDNSDDRVYSTDDDDLILILTGREPDGANQQNTKSINFLTLKEGKQRGTGGIDGIIYDDSTGDPTGIFDPWGEPYYIIMDFDYDERILGNSITPKQGNPRDLNARRVAVWSNGADVADGGAGDPTDDVTTW